jgi:hypothetical protein
LTRRFLFSLRSGDEKDDFSKKERKEKDKRSQKRKETTKKTRRESNKVKMSPENERVEDAACSRDPPTLYCRHYTS